MTTIRIPPLAVDAGGEGAGLASIRLVDAKGRALIGLRTTDGAPVTAYASVEIPAAGPAWEPSLTPQSAIATEGGADTYYLIEVRARYHAQRWMVQVPDQATPIDLADLVAGSAVAPGDILAGRLMPDASSEPDDRWITTQDGAWVTTDAPPGSGIPDAPSTGSPYVRKDGGWAPMLDQPIAPTQIQGAGNLAVQGNIGIGGTPADSVYTLSSDRVRTGADSYSVEVFGRATLTPSANTSASVFGVWGEAQASGAHTFSGNIVGVYGEADASSGASTIDALAGVMGRAKGTSDATVGLAAGIIGGVLVDDTDVDMSVCLLAQEPLPVGTPTGVLSNVVGVGVSGLSEGTERNIQLFLSGSPLLPVTSFRPTAPNGSYGILQEGTAHNVLGGPLTVQGVAFADKANSGDLAAVATSGAYADLSGTPSLGTAASQDVGTGAGDVVQLDGSARLPAVDGSQLTGLPGGVSDHGALSGLLDDDHSQYHTDARGDARYSWLGHNHAGVYDPAGTAAGAISAHEGAADPHPAYTTAAEAAAAAPVQSVAGRTGAVVLAQADVSGTVPTTRTVSAGTGLTGGGDLSANRSLAVSYGSSAGTACEGNDSRLSDARTPTAHTHPADQISDSTAVGRAILTGAAASQAEMEAGTETALRAMSPLLVAQAVNIRLPADQSGSVFPGSYPEGRTFYRTDRGVLYFKAAGGFKAVQSAGDLVLYVNPTGNGDAFDSGTGGGATTITAALLEIPPTCGGSVTVHVAYSATAYAAETVYLPQCVVPAGSTRRIVGGTTVALSTTLASAATEQNLATPTKTLMPVSATLTANAHRAQLARISDGSMHAIWDNDTTTLTLAGSFYYGLAGDLSGARNSLTLPSVSSSIEILNVSPVVAIYSSGAWEINLFELTGNIQYPLVQSCVYNGIKVSGSGAMVMFGGSMTIRACSTLTTNAHGLYVRSTASAIIEACGFRAGANGALRAEENGVVTIRSATAQQSYGTAGQSVLLGSGSSLLSTSASTVGFDVFNPSMGGGTGIKISSTAGTKGLTTTNHRIASNTVDSATYGYLA